MTESYSVDTKYKHKKKYPAGNQTVCNAFVRAFDDMQFNESLTVRGYQYGTLIKNGKSSCLRKAIKKQAMKMEL